MGGPCYGLTVPLKGELKLQPRISEHELTYKQDHADGVSSDEVTLRYEGLSPNVSGVLRKRDMGRAHCDDGGLRWCGHTQRTPGATRTQKRQERASPTDFREDTTLPTP